MTSQQPNGQQNLEKQLDDLLDSYNAANNTQNEFNGDVAEYLSMSRDHLESLSKEDRYTAALRLAQFSIYLQRLINREKARVSFANATINSVAAANWGNFSEYIKYDIKINKLAQESSTISKAIRLKNRAQVCIDELDGVSQLVKHFSDMMMRSTYVVG